MVQWPGAGLQYTAYCVADPAARVGTIPSRPHRSPTNTTETVTMDIPRYALLAASALLGFHAAGRMDSLQRRARAPRRDRKSPWSTQSRQATDAPLKQHLEDVDAVCRHTRLRTYPRRPDLGVPAPAQLGTPQTAPYRDGSLAVHTDVLEVMIDLQGGDVVGAGFKDFPKTLADTSEPFVLLERNSQRTYTLHNRA